MLVRRKSGKNTKPIVREEAVIYNSSNRDNRPPVRKIAVKLEIARREERRRVTGLNWWLVY